ncbi:MAG: hypothetical protein K9L82_19345 [Chromatiaceae bacterium]|nr:hypothetical protein [Halochromatium roseum]MCF7980120.1 hypothetical protein [Chromatiaceae bacterium]MCF8005217.1 hypothetical protein [Chromatiaceae bacterium]
MVATVIALGLIRSTAPSSIAPLSSSTLVSRPSCACSVNTGRKLSVMISSEKNSAGLKQSKTTSGLMGAPKVSKNFTVAKHREKKPKSG